MTTLTRETYLKRLTTQEKEKVERIERKILAFSQEPEWEPYFETCGLYAIGSNLTKD